MDSLKISPSHDSEQRPAVEITKMSAVLRFDLKRPPLDPLVQYGRAHRAIARVKQWGETPLTNDNAIRILDDFISACVWLRHIFDWALAVAAPKGKQSTVEAIMRAREVRVISDICNGSKHLLYVEGGEKTKGSLRLSAEGEISRTTSHDYAASMTVECEGQTWQATDLLDRVLADWKRLLTEEFGLPAEWATEDDRAESVAARLVTRIEEALRSADAGGKHGEG